MICIACLGFLRMTGGRLGSRCIPPLQWNFRARFRVLARHYDLLLYMEDELCLSCAQMATLRL